jgi:AraC-like DNA-binding protein
MALEVMRAADMDLTEVAHATGFAHHSHFTSSFRAMFGITPSQLRNRMNT